MSIHGFPELDINPAICGGRPVIAGTRVRVSDVLDMLGNSADIVTIVADYPYLSVEGIQACLRYAAAQFDHSVVLAAE